MWWIVAALILFGIIMMFVETLLTPGVGVAGVLSLFSLAASCWYSFTFISGTAGIWVTIACCVLVLVCVMLMLRSKTWKHFELDTQINSRVNIESDKVIVGETGVTLTRLAPMGTAEFSHTTCEVKSHDNNMIDAGTQVEVVKIEDKKVIVKTIE